MQIFNEENILFLKDALQILILAWILFKLYLFISVTKISQLILSVIYYSIGYIFCYLLKLDFLIYLYHHVTIPLIMFICIIYHIEFKRGITFLLSGRMFRFRRSDETTENQIDTILNAVESLIAVKRGALIIFPRQTDIKTIIDSGTKLNADLSSSLIGTIFDHDTPLHDGGVVIKGSKILAASCYLPLSSQLNISVSFGTRHRAALGLAEESDALILVVSEENGSVSLAYNANIYYDLDFSTVKKVILSLMSFHNITPQDVKEDNDEE